MSNPKLDAILASLDTAQLALHDLIESTRAKSPDAHSGQPFTFAATLHDQLVHYRELFGQLRLGYLEQVTKEKFLVGITEHRPKVVESQENAELEEKLRGAKEELKRSKREVEEILAELAALGTRLSLAYEQLMCDVATARTLPVETAHIRAHVGAHERTKDMQPDMNLPLVDTLGRVDAATSELRMLETELESLKASLPRCERQLENLRKEILVHENEKEGLEKFASEAVRAREGARAAGKADRENMGQWHKSSYEVLSALLDKTG